MCAGNAEGAYDFSSFVHQPTRCKDGSDAMDGRVRRRNLDIRYNHERKPTPCLACRASPSWTPSEGNLVAASLSDCDVLVHRWSPSGDTSNQSHAFLSADSPAPRWSTRAHCVGVVRHSISDFCRSSAISCRCRSPLCGSCLACCCFNT